MVTKIQKTRFNLKPVTYCYNLIHKKACFSPQNVVAYSMIKKENIKGEKVMNLETKKILMNDCSAMDLDSVGSTITSELMIFPQVVNEPPETASEVEEMMGTHLYDCDDEWFTSLSFEDLTDLLEFVELNGDVVKVTFNNWKILMWSKWENVNNCYMNLETV